MYEYMNPGFIATGGLILFMGVVALIANAAKAHEKGIKIEHPYPLYIIMILVIALPIVDAYDTKERVLKSKKLFKNNETIICSSLLTSYQVSQNKGWYYLNKENLTDGNVILSIRMCKELEN